MVLEARTQMANELEPPARPMAESARVPRPGGPDPAAEPHRRVAIIGAGFGGLGMAIRLLQHGERDFVLLERADDVGGTWRDNTYPGCQCDVASNIYSFSFAPNPNWSRTFAWQGEILDYLRDCADRFGVRPHIRFGHEVREAHWIEARQHWRLETNHGTVTADTLVSGHGFLSEPSVPEIKGLERFKGTLFHSGAWRHDHSLKGERVAVIGTGASAIQVVPAIQPEVGKLTLFQRTPAWIVPRGDFAWSKLKRWLFENAPFLQTLDRFREYAVREIVVLGMRNPEHLRAGERMALRHLAAQVKDPELRKRLTPSYKIGCKRILLSNDFYPALTKPNVELVTSGIREVVENGVITEDGALHEVDTIIPCTGFKVTDHPIGHCLFGRDGRPLAEHWQLGAAAYLGTTVTGFPNLFMLTGPNTGLGHNSMVYMLESQFTYILGALDAMKARDAGAFEVKAEVQAAYCDELQQQLKGTVWSSGCASWYLDARGHNTTVWPTFSFKYRERTKHFDARAYRFEARREHDRVAPEAAAVA